MVIAMLKILIILIIFIITFILIFINNLYINKKFKFNKNIIIFLLIGLLLEFIALIIYLLFSKYTIISIIAVYILIIFSFILFLIGTYRYLKQF
jgi:hypothetical protein